MVETKSSIIILGFSLTREMSWEDVILYACNSTAMHLTSHNARRSSISKEDTAGLFFKKQALTFIVLDVVGYFECYSVTAHFILCSKYYPESGRNIKGFKETLSLMK